MKKFMFDLQRFKNIDNSKSKIVINGTSDNDEIYNTGSTVTINGGEGNDGIDNGGYDSSDTWHKGGSKVIINGGAGNDCIYNRGKNTTILGGDGDDDIHTGYLVIYDDSLKASYGESVLIDGGAGDDSISTNVSNVTIIGGEGNDSIAINCYPEDDGSIYYSDDYGLCKNLVFKYASGDGNDVIYGFKADSTLSIGGGSYSTTKSGKNIIVTVDDGKISLIGAASLGSDLNIKFKKTSETNSWKLNGTTATYGTSNKTLVTVSGVKSLDGISLSGKVVTVKAASLGTSKVTVSDGYTLKLGDDVSTPSTSNKWTISGTTAKYNQTTTVGYKLADNAINYSKKAVKTLATVKGIKSVKGLSISGKVIKVAASSLNKKKVTISGTGYTLKLGSDVSASSTKKAAFSLNGSIATYKSSYKTAGYSLASDGKSISYTKATTAESLATIKGAASTSGLSVSGNKITLKKSALKNKVTVGGGYEFDFASDYKKATIMGSSSGDTITTRGSNLSINGGAGDDTIKVLGSNTTVTGGKGSDTFIYKSGKNVISDYAAEDFISITSGTAKVTTSGNDVVLTAGKCTITVTGGKNEKITYFDAGGKKTYAFSDTASTDIKFNKDKTSATLLSSYDPDSFAFSDKLITLNATAVMQPLMITGNKKKNNITGSGEDDYIDGGIGADTIKGGKGNDTLIGGAGNDSIHGGEGSDSLWGGAGDDYLYGGDGADIFIYNDGEGNDRIFDYNSDVDTIKLLSGTVKNIEAVGNDVVFTIGTGKIVLDGAAGRYAAIIDSSGEVKPYNPKNRS